jgi:hypothetical protein
MSAENISTISVASTGSNPSGFRNIEELDFRVRIARTGEVFERAVSVRNEAFTRHGHPFSRTRFIVESADLSEASIVLCAEDKRNGEPLGAMRIEDNRIGELKLNRELEIPKHYLDVPAILVSRLTVQSGKVGHLARNALCKAMYLYAVAVQAQFIFVVAKPPRDRLYKPMGFKPIFDDDRLVEIASNSNVPAKVLVARVRDFESLWREQQHPLHSFVVDTYHPDLELFASVSGPHRRRRLSDGDSHLPPSNPTSDFGHPIA